jgi:hypothetical protein
MLAAFLANWYDSPTCKPGTQSTFGGHLSLSLSLCETVSFWSVKYFTEPVCPVVKLRGNDGIKLCPVARTDVSVWWFTKSILTTTGNTRIRVYDRVEVPMALEKVLVVDDNEAVRSSLCKTLEKHGFEVTCAADVSEALRVHQRPNI